MTTTAAPATDFRKIAENALGTKFVPAIEKAIQNASSEQAKAIEKIEAYIKDNVTDDALKAKLTSGIEERKTAINATSDAVKMNFARAMVEILSAVGLPVMVIEAKTRKARSPNKTATPVNNEHVAKVTAAMSNGGTLVMGTPELVTASGLTSEQIKPVIAYLKSENKLVTVGKGRGTKWHLAPAPAAETAPAPAPAETAAA